MGGPLMNAPLAAQGKFEMLHGIGDIGPATIDTGILECAVEQLARAIPFYRQRTYVKPGLTGWAQVNFPYGASIEDAREKLAYDLYYVKNRSMMLDLIILISTIRVVLFREGAR